MHSTKDANRDGSEERFRAIIVGGGVTGLIASHCFSKAQIDHIVLERGSEAAPALGASIAIYPHVARILQQLDVLREVDAVSEAIGEGATERWPDGSPYAWSDVWRFIRENHGHDLVFSERRAFLQVLYDCLPDKSRVLLGKQVSRVVQDANGVEVQLSDGTSERGDIIIGCDGVHSIARTAMWEHICSSETHQVDEEEKTAISAKWQCLIGYGPAEPNVKNEVSVVHDEGFSLMLINPPSQVFFSAFVKIDEPHTLDKPRKYTKDDADRLAKSIGNRQVTDGLSFGDLWKKKFRGHLVDAEQGMLERWHFERFVLTGDSVHKMTPNAALGGNAGIESVAVLTNELRKLLVAHDGKRPSTSALTGCFKRYEAKRKPRLKQILALAESMARSQTWDSPLIKLLCLWVFPHLPQRTLTNQVGKLIQEGPMLDFLPLGPWPESQMSWKSESTTKESGRWPILDAFVKSWDTVLLIIIVAGLLCIYLGLTPKHLA